MVIANLEPKVQATSMRTLSRRSAVRRVCRLILEALGLGSTLTLNIYALFLRTFSPISYQPLADKIA